LPADSLSTDGVGGQSRPANEQNPTRRNQPALVPAYEARGWKMGLLYNVKLVRG